MGFLLTALGVLLLLSSLAGVAFGLYMALDPRTRKPGLYFALWWTPAVATASGILMRDPATFAISAVCFVVAGIAFALERRGSRQRSASRDKRTRPESTHESTKRRRAGIAKHWSALAKRWLAKARTRK